MVTITLLVVIGTSIWVLIDARTIGTKKGQIKGMGDMGPWGWFFACLLLWIVAFPFYLAKRGEFKMVNATQRGESPATTTPQLCVHCGKYYEGNPSYCPNCGSKIEKV